MAARPPLGFVVEGKLVCGYLGYKWVATERPLQ